MSKTHQKLKAFTLIEILITIVILAILAGLTIIALNPGQNIDDANDVRRKTDVNTLLSAIWQYNVDNNGSFPSDITSTAQAISNSAADICTDLVPTYMAAIPADPTTGSYTDCTTYASGYTVSTANNHVTVSATLSDSSAYSQTR
ncbi:MAG: prepilin-type N-terminal cleavage/methylation domain-containing protein [bacterium]|nr:prepilin-type N-terminal cleavage/methylation domain-containing protein [bacterium]